MSNNIFNNQKIADILSKATWDYTYNMQRIDESVMQGLLGILGNTKFTKMDVEKALKGTDINDALNVFEKETSQTDINDFMAFWIADLAAWAIVDCPYETVTFHLI